MAVRKLTVYKKVEAELVQFEEDYSSIVIDCSTTKGMQVAKASRKDIRDVRLNLEDLRKETKAPVLAKGKQIDAEAKVITIRLLVLEDRFDDAIKAVENAKELAKQKELDDARAKLKDLDDREAAIVAKEIELGLREAPEQVEQVNVTSDKVNTSTATTDVTPDSSDDVSSSTNSAVTKASVICEPHIKAAAERLGALKKIRNLVEATDPQPKGDIDKDIASTHDITLEKVWSIVDEYQ